MQRRIPPTEVLDEFQKNNYKDSNYLIKIIFCNFCSTFCYYVKNIFSATHEMLKINKFFKRTSVYMK